MEKLLKDGVLCKLLEEVDWDLAEAIRVERCRYCGAKLHCGDFTRKPRGVVVTWDKRHSFDCSRCRKRHTPPSVRFLGRKVYAGIVVVLVAAMMHGPNARRIDTLHEALGIDRRTLNRWRQWWLETFVQSGFWKGARARFMPRLDEEILPLSLVDEFGAKRRDSMVNLLSFLSPIGVSGGLEGVAM